MSGDGDNVPVDGVDDGDDDKFVAADMVSVRKFGRRSNQSVCTRFVGALELNKMIFLARCYGY